MLLTAFRRLSPFLTIRGTFLDPICARNLDEKGRCVGRCYKTSFSASRRLLEETAQVQFAQLTVELTSPHRPGCQGDCKAIVTSDDFCVLFGTFFLARM